MPFDIIQITAQYSNAVLVAVMPYVSDFAHRLNLPIPQPVTASQVSEFKCSPRTDLFGGRVILTNGFEFTFLHGRIDSFWSPSSYYFLQDPAQIPNLFGPVTLTETEALQIAHDSIKNLGYTDVMLSADQPPQVTPPPDDRGHRIARYRIRWYDPTRGHNPRNPPPSVEFEISATTGQVEMMSLKNPNTWRDDPGTSVHPTITNTGPVSVPVGPGRKIYPVSEAYSNAFLAAILPQCTAYAKSLSFAIGYPIKPDDVNRNNYTCGLVDNAPWALFDLKSGARFVYSHGQVVAAYAPDVMELPGRDNPHTHLAYEQFQAKFYGPINMTDTEAVNLVRQTVVQLGYSPSVLNIQGPPQIEGPSWWGTNHIARCYIAWKNSFEGPTRVSAEVDMTTKTLKSLYVNDHINTNIWRNPPKVNVAFH